jgi:hypothetical protein
MEIPYTGRAIVNESYNGTEIIVPVKKNWFLVIFMCFWLCGWFFGEASALGEIYGSVHKGMANGFIMFWFCGWTFGGFFALSVLWWNFAGKEIITVSQGVLTIVKKGTLAKDKSYDLNEVKNFRAIEEASNDFGFGSRSSLSPFNSAGKGTIKFDYGMETVKFGDQLYQAEAEYLLGRLRDKKLIN